MNLYTKYNDPWETGATPEGADATPIRAAALDHIEAGILAASTLAHEAVLRAAPVIEDDLNAGGNKIINLAAATAGGHAVSRAAGDARYLGLAGGTMTGAIAMSDEKITGLGTPTSGGDAATKAYADLKAALAGATFSGTVVVPAGTRTAPGLRVGGEQQGLWRDSANNAGFTAPAAVLLYSRQSSAGGTLASFRSNVGDTFKEVAMMLANGTLKVGGALAAGTGLFIGANGNLVGDLGSLRAQQTGSPGYVEVGFTTSSEKHKTDIIALEDDVDVDAIIAEWQPFAYNRLPKYGGPAREWHFTTEQTAQAHKQLLTTDGTYPSHAAGLALTVAVVRRLLNRVAVLEEALA